MASVLVGTGCEVPPRTDPTSDDAAVTRPGTPSDWASLVRSQNHRLELLDLFTSAGTITIDMRDDDDRMQREQADHRIWRGGAARSAIKISKLGSTLISAAWNGPRWWIFDESGDEVTLQIRTVGARSSARGTDRLLAPPILMAMIGLVPFPAVVPEDFVRIGEDFRFTLRGIEVGDGSGRVFFPGKVEIRVHRPLDGPAAVRLLDETGAEVARSELTRVESVDRIGSAPGAWPRFPHRVEIRRDRGERLVMSFDAPLAGGRISDRLFDLDVQIERSKPVRIDEARGSEEE
ncbi:MAG: hypothetical protein P8I74_03305 [Phycisphaerales bacterium]|nr:hypothetical protein [Phycisphaerales bacterium]